MWPFKKKKTSLQHLTPKTFETVICIPGNWSSWDEFILVLVTATNGEFLAAGNILMNVKKKQHYTIEFCERDDKMEKSFSYAGLVNGVSNDFISEIGNHKNVIYISGPTGSLDGATHIAFAAGAILKAGGLGIKIETAGKAFEKDDWHNLLETFEESNLYKMFVLDSISDEDGTVFSCGMQNLGFKDTIVSGEEFQQAAALISIFGYYQIIDKPIIQDRQTFSTDTASPMFRIMDEPKQPYKGHNLFGNPFGMWRLTKV